MKEIGFILISFFILFSCKKTIEINNTTDNEYAENFSIETEGDQWEISSAKEVIYLPKDFIVKKCILTTTSASAYLDVLGKIETIVGVCSPDYFYNTKILRGIKNNTIENVGNDATLNFEKILRLKPDVIITTHNANYEKILHQLSGQGIKIIYVEEYNETHPLGKTEYLKLFGALFNENKKSDSLYNKIKEEYLMLKQKAMNTANKPTVFTNIMYGDAWYIAGGKSFIATMFADAGVSYLWKENKQTGTIPLSFEEVFSKAKNAEYWIGASNFKSKEELSNANRNYTWFDAYKNKKVYTMNNRENKAMANDYYESGSVYANKALADIIKIVHPELLPEYTLTYFKKLE